MSDPRAFSTDKLHTEDGITEVAALAAIAYRDDVLLPILDHTPPHMRQAVWERLLCAIVGVGCAELGPDAMKEALNEAKRAIDETRKRRGH